MGVRRGSRETGWLTRWALIVGLVFDVTVTVVFYFVVRDREQELLRLETERRARIYTDAIQHGIDRNVSVLSSLVALYATHDEIDRDEFRVFVETGGLLRPDVQALEWIPLVPHAERVRYESLARDTWIADFGFTEKRGREMVPASERSHYHPVYYVEPRRGNDAAIGFDLGSNQARRAALDQARDRGRMATTERITLVQETGSQAGVLMVAPIYSTGRTPDTMAERREVLTGHVLGVFRVSSMIEAALPNSSLEGVEFGLHDEGALAGEGLLYRNSPEIAEHLDDSAIDGLRRTHGPVERIPLRLPGRTWLATFVPTTALIASHGPRRSREILVGGMLYTAILAVFLGVYFIRLARRTAEAHQLASQLEASTRDLEAEVAQRRVAQQELRAAHDTLEVRVHERTAELERSNRDLEEFAYAASHDLRAPLRAINQLAEWLEEDLGQALTGDNAEKMRLLRGRVARMDALLTALLVYSRVGRKQTRIETVDVGSLIHEIVDSLGEDRTIDAVISDDLPTLTTIRVGLFQIFANLIGNAVKHSHRDRVHVEVVARDAGDFWEFVVSDDGPGIPPELRDQAFGMFETLKPRDEVEGSGMGLALVAKQAAVAGGEVTLEESTHGGLTVRFTWPKDWPSQS